MSGSGLPKLLIVDDEEAILETMSFTFMDVYDVLTTSDPLSALQLIKENAPVAAVITDQRMPGLTGVELLKQVYERFPETVRIILTGFADSEATIQAINDGHIYAYINKPWEPEELKQVVKRAVEHHALTLENRRLVENLQTANIFLEAVMDHLATGAIAVDAQGIVQALNKPARSYLGLAPDARGSSLEALLGSEVLAEVGAAVKRLSFGQGDGSTFEDLDIKGGPGHRVRVSCQGLESPDGTALGSVITFKESSHEPLRRKFEEIVSTVSAEAPDDECVRDRFEAALGKLVKLSDRVSDSQVTSPSMHELGEKISRTRTAIENWLDVDDVLAREEFPDAQLLLDRLRVSNGRWPYPEALPPRVGALADRVEAYYESGENSRQRVL